MRYLTKELKNRCLIAGARKIFHFNHPLPNFGCGAADLKENKSGRAYSAA
jgi:hypothetical protein